MAMRGALLVLLAILTVGPVAASDRWEYVAYSSGDDNSSTLNFLQHGAVQRAHDLESFGNPVDQDWFSYHSLTGHSYEARVNGGIMYWGTTCVPLDCPRFDLVDSAGAVLTAGEISGDDAPIVINRGASGPQNAGRGMTVRWIATARETGFLRAQSDLFNPFFGPEVTYDIVFRDTTYLAPRWNNSGSQVSVFVIQNATSATVTGEIHFHNGAGTLLHTAPLAVPSNGVQVLNTASIGALASQSGGATIAQLGGYGALAAKAVALEPATGFTFDTVIAPIPY